MYCSFFLKKTYIQTSAILKPPSHSQHSTLGLIIVVRSFFAVYDFRRLSNWASVCDGFHARPSLAVLIVFRYEHSRTSIIRFAYCDRGLLRSETALVRGPVRSSRRCSKTSRNFIVNRPVNWSFASSVDLSMRLFIPFFRISPDVRVLSAFRLT